MLPDEAQQLLPGERLPGPAAELQEQPQLGRRQLEVLAVLRDRHRGPVDDQGPEDGGIGGLPFPSAQHGPDPGVEHPALDRLDDVVVGAGLQAHHHVDVVTARGEQDDRQLVGAADPPAHLETVDPGQHHVQHDQVRPLLAQQFQAVLARRRGGHTVALARQGEFEGRADGVVVLDQQQERHGLILSHGPFGVRPSGARDRTEVAVTGL